MNKSFIIKLGVAVVLLLSSLNTFAQKGLPGMRDYKEFGIKGKNVEKVLFTVKNADGVLLETEEIHFDKKGYRNKEVIKNPKQTLFTTTWDYNTKENTVDCYRLSPVNATEWRKSMAQDKKTKHVELKHIAPWLDITTDSLIKEAHHYTENWTMKDGKIEKRQLTLNLRVGRIASATTERSDLSKYNTIAQNVNTTIHQYSYNWLFNYITDNLKAKTIKLEEDENQITYYKNKKGMPFEKKVVSKVDKQVLDHTTYTMEYDKKKNWIKLVQLENGIPKYTVTREITYR